MIPPNQWNTRASLWVKCGDRLPEPAVEVLCAEGDVVSIGFYDDDAKDWCFDSVNGCYPSHWQPLPQPRPKASKYENKTSHR